MASKSGVPVILQTLPEMHTGGVERGAVDIAAAIAREGWTSLVASAGGKLESKLAYAKAEHIRLPMASKNPLTIWRNATRLAAVIRERGVSVIHARSRAPAWSAFLAARATGIPLVTTFHGIYGHSAFGKKTYNRVMVRGERVIAVSRFVADHIYTHYGMDSANLRVIHRGVDIKLFARERIQPGRLAALMREWHLPDDSPPIILMPGRLARWKGQDVLIEALARLPHRDFLCLLVGPPQGHPRYAAQLRELIRKRGLEGYVRMVGDTDAMTEAYTLSSLVVTPSVEPEAFGRVAAEAQAMGRPVIAARHGGACETVIDGHTGWLVAPGDADDLARAIDRALALPAQEREQMSRHAAWNIQAHFSLERMCEQTLDVYAELLGADARAAKKIVAPLMKIA